MPPSSTNGLICMPVILFLGILYVILKGGTCIIKPRTRKLDSNSCSENTSDAGKNVALEKLEDTLTEMVNVTLDTPN